MFNLNENSYSVTYVQNLTTQRIGYIFCKDFVIYCNPAFLHFPLRHNRFVCHVVSFFNRYADDFRRLTDEITAAAETCRETRARLIEEFHDKLRRLIDDGVNESRKLERCPQNIPKFWILKDQRSTILPYPLFPILLL